MLRIERTLITRSMCTDSSVRLRVNCSCRILKSNSAHLASAEEGIEAITKNECHRGFTMNTRITS